MHIEYFNVIVHCLPSMVMWFLQWFFRYGTFTIGASGASKITSTSSISGDDNSGWITCHAWWKLSPLWLPFVHSNPHRITVLLNNILLLSISLKPTEALIMRIASITVCPLSLTHLVSSIESNPFWSSLLAIWCWRSLCLSPPHSCQMSLRRQNKTNYWFFPFFFARWRRHYCFFNGTSFCLTFGSLFYAFIHQFPSPSFPMLALQSSALLRHS